MSFLKQIPNILTLGNLVMGCIAILYFAESNYELLEYDPQAGDYTVRFFSEKLILGTVFIFIAACFDFADGLVARVLNASSKMGEYLDSLCDVVSFGVAPGMLIYQMLKYSWANYQQASSVPQILLIPTLLIPMASAWRLAKFNSQQAYEKKFFLGLPTPATGLALAALAWGGISIDVIRNLIYNPFFIYGVIFFFSGLMVSNTPMHKLNLQLTEKINLIILISISLISIVGFFILGYLIIFLSITVYIILSYILYFHHYAGEKKE